MLSANLVVDNQEFLCYSIGTSQQKRKNTKMKKLVASTALAAVLSNAAYAGTVVNSTDFLWLGTAYVDIDNHCEFVTNTPGKMIFFKDEDFFGNEILITGFSTDTSRGGEAAYVEMNVKNISHVTVAPAAPDYTELNNSTWHGDDYNSYVENVDTGDKYAASTGYVDPMELPGSSFVAVSNGVTTPIATDISANTGGEDIPEGYLRDYNIAMAPDAVPDGQTATLKLSIGGLTGVKSVNDYDDIVYGSDIADGDYAVYHKISCMQ